MDINKNNIDNKKENSLEKFDVETDKLSMGEYFSDVKVYKSPLEEVSKNLLISNIDTKALKNFNNVSQSYVKALTPIANYYARAINFSSIKPTVEKAIKVNTISTNTEVFNFTKEISKLLTMNESYTNMVESIKNVTTNSSIGVKFFDKMDFNIPNIGMESSVKISNSFKELLKDYPVKIDIDIPSLEESIDRTDIFFSKPSEMTNFILDNTENAQPLTVEEAETIDSLMEAKDENELIKAYDKGVKIFGGNVELLISYIILIVTILASFSNDFYAGTLYGKTIDEFLDPAFKDIHKRAKKILEPKDNEASKNDNSKE